MKKFLLTAVIACSGLSLFAQTNSTVSTSPVSFGIKAGVNLSSVTGDLVVGKKSSLIGLNGGVFATIHASESFAVQPELAWSTLGFKSEGNITGGTGTQKVKNVLNYLTLPVLAKYTFAGSGFSLYAGPQIGLLLSAKAKFDGSDASSDIKDGLKSTDFAGVAGLEFEFPNTPFNISGRYQFGFTKYAESGTDSKINAATFTIGYRFN